MPEPLIIDLDANVVEDIVPDGSINSDNLVAGIYIKRRDDKTNASLELVTSVEVIDNVVHSVYTIGYDPETMKSTSWHREADGVYENYIIEPQGEKVRTAQRDQLTARVVELGNDLKQLTANRPEPPLLLAAPNTPADAKTTELALTRYQGDMQVFQKNVEALTTDMQQTSSGLSVLLSENANLMKAQISDTTAEIQKVMSAVTTLQAFCLEHTDTQQLIDGPGAPADEPLHLYQQLLYMDEEMLAHKLVDGRDHRSGATLAKAMSDDPGLLDRLIPAPRGVVLMQASRNIDVYHRQSIKGLLDAWGLINEIKADEMKMILTRDGQRVFITYIPEHIHGKVTNLFPSETQFKQIFKSGWNSTEELQWKDLAYARARQKFDSITQAYRRLLLIIAGLQLKHKVFGPFEHLNPMSLTRADFHRDRVVYIRDEEMIPDRSRPTVEQYLSYLTNEAMPGDIILLYKSFVNDPNITPALATRNEHDGKSYFNYKALGDTVQVLTVQGPVEDPFVTMMFEYDGFSDRVIKREAKARCYINRSPDREHYNGNRFIKLTYAAPADLLYYINSRRARQNFHNRAGLMEAAMTAAIGIRQQYKIPDSVKTGRDQAARIYGTRSSEFIRPHPETVLTTHDFHNTYRHYTKVPRPSNPDLDQILGDGERYIVTEGRQQVPTLVNAKTVTCSLPLLGDPTKYYAHREWTTIDQKLLYDSNWDRRGDLVTATEIALAGLDPLDATEAALAAMRDGKPVHGMSALELYTYMLDKNMESRRNTVLRFKIVQPVGVWVRVNYQEVLQMVMCCDSLVHLYRMDPGLARDFIWKTYREKTKKLDWCVSQAAAPELHLQHHTIYDRDGDVSKAKPLKAGLEEGESYGYHNPFGGDTEQTEVLAKFASGERLYVTGQRK